MVAVKQLVLLKFGQSHGLRQAHRLQSLHLTTKFIGEAWYETTQQEQRSESDDSICEALKLHQIIIHDAPLLQFEEGVVRGIVVRQSKSWL